MSNLFQIDPSHPYTPRNIALWQSTAPSQWRTCSPQLGGLRGPNNHLTINNLRAAKDFSWFFMYQECIKSSFLAEASRNHRNDFSPHSTKQWTLALLPLSTGGPRRRSCPAFSAVSDATKIWRKVEVFDARFEIPGLSYPFISPFHSLM